MTKIYMVRHCEAMGNVLRLFQGTSDLDISELGETQLKYLQNRFADIHLDRVFSSPLIRTQKTAAAIIGDKNLTPETEKGLIELDGGIVEGKPFLEACRAMPELGDAWDNHPEDFAPEGGETMRHGYERIWETVKKIAIENKGKTIACATHGGVIRCLLCRLCTNDIHQLKNIPISGNTAVSLIEFDDSFNPTVVFYNDTSHLPPKVLKRSSKVISSNAEDEQ